MSRFFAAIVLLFLSPFAVAGDSKRPPVKMGLWQEEVSTSISGVDGVSAIPQRDTEQVCITPESWRTRGLQASNSNRCTTLNLQWDAHKLSYDEQCGAQDSPALVFRMYIMIDNDQHMHGTAATIIATPGSAHQDTHSGTWESTLTASYLGSDCGDLKPGEQRPVKQ